jgi:putative ABC transport system permease protein
VKGVTLVFLALKYLIRYRRRYLFLFAALTFGFSIVTLITSIKDGMYENVYNSAQDHYAGDIISVGYDADTTASSGHLDTASVDTILAAIEETGMNPSRIVKRTLFGERGVLYYNGAAVRQKYIVGVDWENETQYFSRLMYQEPPRQPLADDDTIVISAPVAAELGARIGDRLILEVETRWGQKNTGVFIIGAIVEDYTIFGYYKSYISHSALNGLLLYAPEDCSTIGMYFPSSGGVEKKRAIFQAALEGKIQTAPIVRDRDELEVEKTKPWTGIKVYVLTMTVYLSEVADLLGAMNILTYFLYGMLLLIIYVSAVVTYRLILHERSRELGTMRVIGFQGVDIQGILVMETLGLGVFSLIAGFVFAGFLSWAIRFVPLSWFPSITIFMKNGKLTALYLPKTMMTNIAAIFCALIIAVWGPAFRFSRKPLPGILNGGAA